MRFRRTAATGALAATGTVRLLTVRHMIAALFYCWGVTGGKRAGKAFPFSRGLSFYKVDAAGKLVFAREIPEPSSPAAASFPCKFDHLRAVPFAPHHRFTPDLPEATARRSTKPGSAGLALARLGAFLMKFVPDSITFPKI